jgi:hypothetical protein
VLQFGLTEPQSNKEQSVEQPWGHVTIRICGYPPFGAQVILNGHQRVERQARRKRLAVIKDGNCFIEGSDFPAIDRLATEFNRCATITSLHQLCERWIYSTCLCFALPAEERRRSHFSYQYSIFQLELSRNLLFWRGTQMNEVYQKLIDRTRAPLALRDAKTIFGFSHRPHQMAKRGRERTEVFKAVQAHSYDLTVFKIKWGNLTLKIYDKGSRVLRIEVVVHNAKELRSGRCGLQGGRRHNGVIARSDGVASFRRVLPHRRRRCVPNTCRHLGRSGAARFPPAGRQ